MASQMVVCSFCGTSFDPAARVCPKCQTSRDPETAPTTFALNTDRPLLEAIQRKAGERSDAEIENSQIVYLSPADEGRRFPLLTRAQMAVIAAGVLLSLLMLLVGYLLWRQQKRDALAVAARTTAQPAASVSPSPVAGPSPLSTPQDDAAVLAGVKAAVTNYNPTGFSAYSLEVKDGIVTVGGNAETQPEKDGVENVIRPVPGVKAIVNNLLVRLTPVMLPSRLSDGETKRLDEALRKGQDTDRQAREDADRRREQIESQQENDRRRRELAATRIREEEDRVRKEAEDKLQREAADYERRLEEQRRLERERRARAEQARLESSVLQSGTIAWTGVVDGVVEVIISGGSASVRNLSGETPREVRSSFSAQVPRSPITAKLLSTAGRGAIAISQEPDATNGYTTIVRLDDSSKGGQQRYEFTLRWTVR
ncbi:MAG: BON domain-containing protein [Acidobacteriota bacterium]